MSSKADTIYLGPSIPSERLRSYLGQHIHLFNVMECEGSSLCEGPIRDLIGDDKLFYNGRNFRTISYPVVVTAGRGHLIADIKKFEDLMSCGNL